jgi:predicted NAD-dependent protein-ADP-ribosyltransferase YbiA (DUF1768 family)
MEMVLRLKLERHPDLKKQLFDTGDETIIEDCTKRPSGKFWGEVLKDGEWVGENAGQALDEARDELRTRRSRHEGRGPDMRKERS